MPATIPALLTAQGRAKTESEVREDDAAMSDTYVTLVM